MQKFQMNPKFLDQFTVTTNSLSKNCAKDIAPLKGKDIVGDVSFREGWMLHA